MLTDGITTTGGTQVKLPAMSLMGLQRADTDESKKGSRVLTAQTFVADEFKPNFEVYSSSAKSLNIVL